MRLQNDEWYWVTKDQMEAAKKNNFNGKIEIEEHDRGQYRIRRGKAKDDKEEKNSNGS